MFGAMNFPVRPVLDELRSISELGFDYFELTMDPPMAHHSAVLRQRDQLLSALESSGMGLVCHLPTFLSLADLNDSLRRASLEEMFASMEVAATLGSSKVVVHPGYVQGLGVFVVDQVRRYALESLTAIVKRADQLGLRLCLENMFPRTNYLSSPDEFAEVFDRFPSLKFTLDTGHANMGSPGGKRIIEFIDRFPERIFHVHASDNFGKDDSHLPIGVGTIDFPRVARRLKGMGYDGTITLEIFSRDRDYLRISRDKFAVMMEQARHTNALSNE